MDYDGNLPILIVVLIVSILLNALFSANESSVISFNDARLKKLGESGHKKAQKILRLLKSPSRFMNMVSVCRMISTSGAVIAACGIWFWNLAPLVIKAWGTDYAGWKMAGGLILVLLAVAFLLLVFGYLIPHKLGAHAPERVAFLTVSPARVFYLLFLPFFWLTSGAAGLFVRLVGVDPDKEPAQVTEEEIRMMVDVGNEKGVIEESDREMINNIFEFDDRTAEDVMTHRTDIVAVADDAKIADIVYLAINEGFSRIPVYHDDIDNIIGIIYVKDLLCLVGCSSSQEFEIKDFIREALYVPEANRCKDLFREFTEKKAHMAVVVDEYGGTSGIVTMEDLLESIVGNIQDEYDDEEEEFQKLNETTFTIDGSADLEDVSKLLGVEFVETDDYDTLGGLIADQLGIIPSEDEHPVVVLQNIEFTVLQTEDRRIAKVKAVKLLPQEEEPPQEEKNDKKTKNKDRD